MTGTELKARREALGLTRPQLAAKFGCTPGLIDAWENDGDITNALFSLLLERAIGPEGYEYPYDVLPMRLRGVPSQTIWIEQVQPDGWTPIVCEVKNDERYDGKPLADLIVAAPRLQRERDEALAELATLCKAAKEMFALVEAIQENQGDYDPDVDCPYCRGRLLVGEPVEEWKAAVERGEQR